MFWLIFVANWLLSFALTFGILLSAATLTLIGLIMPSWSDRVFETQLFYSLSSLIWLPLMAFAIKNRTRNKIRWAFWIAWLPPIIAAAIVIAWAIQSNEFVLMVLLTVVTALSVGGYAVMRVMISLAFSTAATTNAGNT
jgi:hypothetical protein